MGCPWAVLRSERGSCKRTKKIESGAVTNHISVLGDRGVNEGTGGNTHHLLRDPGIKKAGSEEGGRKEAVVSSAHGRSAAEGRGRFREQNPSFLAAKRKEAKRS